MQKFLQSALTLTYNYAGSDQDKTLVLIETLFFPRRGKSDNKWGRLTWPGLTQ